MIACPGTAWSIPGSVPSLGITDTRSRVRGFAKAETETTSRFRSAYRLEGQLVSELELDGSRVCRSRLGRSRVVYKCCGEGASGVEDSGWVSLIGSVLQKTETMAR